MAKYSWYSKYEFVNGKPNIVWLNPHVETFFDIPDWPEYKISNLGTVLSLRSGLYLKQYKTHRGHPQTHVYLTTWEGQRVQMNVMKLMRKTFFIPKSFRLQLQTKT